MITRRNMHCLVTAGNHISNTWAIARQLLCKRVPVARDTHEMVKVMLDCNNGNNFSCGSCQNIIVKVNRVPEWKLSAIQLSEVTWSRWRENSVVSYQMEVSMREKTRRLEWNGRQPGTQLVELSIDKSSAEAAVTRGPEYGKLKNLPRRSCCQEMASGDCDRLRTLVCLCQQSVNHSSEWCIQGINKHIHQSIPRLQSHTLSMWQHISFIVEGWGMEDGGQKAKEKEKCKGTTHLTCTWSLWNEYQRWT
jgi:hypothetical protein